MYCLWYMENPAVLFFNFLTHLILTSGFRDLSDFDEVSQTYYGLALVSLEVTIDWCLVPQDNMWVIGADALILCSGLWNSSAHEPEKNNMNISDIGALLSFETTCMIAGYVTLRYSEVKRSWVWLELEGSYLAVHRFEFGKILHFCEVLFKCFARLHYINCSHTSTSKATCLLWNNM